MALRDQPYLPLYVQDIMTDERLNECSAATHGIFIKGIMCLMHKSEEYGKILLEQKYKQTDNQIKNFALKICKHTPYNTEEIISALVELIDNKVCHIEGDFLCQKRMIKDGLLSLTRSKIGHEGGKQTQRKFAKAKSKAKHKPNSEYVNDNEIEDINVKKKESKKIYGSHAKIMLTDNELERLIADYGEFDTNKAIQYLSEYGQMKASAFKKYSDHNLVLRKWVFDAIKPGFNSNVKETIVDKRNRELNNLLDEIDTALHTTKGE